MLRVLVSVLFLFSVNLFAGDRYIVGYKDNFVSARSFVASLPSVSAIKNFETINAQVITADLKDVERIRGMDSVDYIEKDQQMSISKATWGLDRIDSREGLDGVYTAPNDGSGVHVYIVDTGINSKHLEFKGRVGKGFSAIKKGGSEDCNGHGTHVAGTTAGTKYGVAKKAIVHPVRVLDCKGSGYNSGVIEGVEWVTKNHIKPAVANMSLGGGASKSLDLAVEKAVESGVVFVVAAGNENQDACKVSPARTPDAITVGASDADDERAYFSNFGDCVDIFAPGVQIDSAWIGGKNAKNTISGTSMASPHIAGAVALYLHENPNADPKEVEAWLKASSTQGIIGDSKTEANDLLFIGDLEQVEPDPEPEPTPVPPSLGVCDYLRVPFFRWLFRCDIS
jgi:subtilisin family serine protease